jgi:hypothetical protein
MALSVYHLTVETVEASIVIGACAATKTEAAAIVSDRLASDGYHNVRVVGTITRVASQGAWSPGGTLLYSSEDKS